MADGSQTENPAVHTHETGDTAHLRSDLEAYKAAHYYSDEFLAQYKASNPKEYKDLDAVLGKWETGAEANEAIAKLNTALDSYMNGIAENMPALTNTYGRYYERPFWNSVQKPYEGNLLDLQQQLTATPQNTERLDAALAFFDQKFSEYVMQLPGPMVKIRAQECAHRSGLDLPQSFWDMYSVQYKGNMQDLVVSDNNRSNRRIDAAVAHVRTIAADFLGKKIGESYAHLDTVTRTQKQRVVDGFVYNNDLVSLIAAYNEAYPPQPEEEEATATEVAQADAGAGTTGVQKAATAEATVEAPTAKIDVRADATANPEKYMDGDKNKFIFKAEKGSDADLHVRIEDIYAVPADHERILTSTNPQLVGMEFKYNPDAKNKKGEPSPSFYEWKNGAFTDQRLVIRAGDTIETKMPEAAPLVADATPAAPAEPVAPAPAPVEEVETIPTDVNARLLLARYSDVRKDDLALSQKKDAERLDIAARRRNGEPVLAPDHSKEQTLIATRYENVRTQLAALDRSAVAQERLALLDQATGDSDARIADLRGGPAEGASRVADGATEQAPAAPTAVTENEADSTEASPWGNVS